MGFFTNLYANASKFSPLLLSSARVNYFSRLQHVMFSSSSKATPSINAAAMQLGRLNHVAIAIPDIKKATAMYR